MILEQKLPLESRFRVYNDWEILELCRCIGELRTGFVTLLSHLERRNTDPNLSMARKQWEKS